MNLKLLVPFLILAVSLFAQQPPVELTVDDAIKLALENNPAYRISEQEVKQYRYRLMENFGFLPQLSLEGSKILKEKLMVIEIPAAFTGGEPMEATLRFTKNYEFTFQLVQPVFTGGKIFYNYKNAELDLRIAKEKERNSREETILNVKKTFYNIQILQELLKAHREAIALAENNFNNVKKSFDLGMSSRYDLLRAELAWSSIKPDILRVENLIETSRLGLNLMIGLPPNQGVVLKGELGYNAYQMEQADMVDKALRNRSELLQLRMEKEKVHNLLKITWAQYVPDFSVVARYSYRSDFFKFTPNNWENYYTINLGVRLPIFTGLKRSSQVGEMQVMNKIIDLNLKQLNDATILEVQNKYRTVKQEYETIQLGIKNMESAAEGVRIAELNYQEGLITILELNSSINELTRAKVNYLQSLYNYNIAIAEIEKLTEIHFNGGNR
jgi:outer membrane protein